MQENNYPPPYLTVAKLEKSLEIARTRSLPRITTAEFAERGFNGTDAALAVKLFKFLGVANDDGTPTPVMDKLRFESVDKRREAFKEIVLSSYAKLFNAVREPQNLDRAELADEMRVAYGVTPRIIETAIPVFLRLCEHAGLKEERTTPSSSPRIRTSADGIRSARRSRNSGNVSRIGNASSQIETLSKGFHTQPVIKGKMSILIPEDLFIQIGVDDEMNEKWRSVLKAAHRFADEFISKKGDMEDEPSP